MTTPNPKKPAVKKSITPKEATMPEPTIEPTPMETPATPEKSKKLSYAEKLALLPPEEAAIIRAKANEASKRSRAKNLGLDPTEMKLQRLEKAVEKAKAKLVLATDEYDAALATFKAAKQEMEQTNDEAK